MIGILVFVAVFLGLLSLSLIAVALRESPLRRRVRHLAGDSRPSSQDNAGSLLLEVRPLEQRVFQLPVLRNIKKLIEQSGARVTPTLFSLGVSALSGSVLAAVYLWRAEPIASIAAAAVAACVPFFYLGSCRKRRRNKFAEQLPDALIMVARSLRAGHSLAAAVELIGQEMPEPSGTLFKAAYEQQQLGIRMTEALTAMSAKIDSIDFHFFVTIIRVNSESGGNLAEILDKLAETVKSRLQVRRQVQTYTAEGRISGYVLLGLPVVVFLAFRHQNPQYMEVFFTVPACQLALLGAFVAQVVGFFVMRKIVDIRI